MNKLKLSYEGQINHLKSKGILFNKVSETKALEYLKLNNNFFKLKMVTKLCRTIQALYRLKAKHL